MSAWYCDPVKTEVCILYFVSYPILTDWKTATITRDREVWSVGNYFAVFKVDNVHCGCFYNCSFHLNKSQLTDARMSAAMVISGSARVVAAR